MDSRQYRSASRFCARLSAASPRLLSRNARSSRRTRASSTELRDSILAFARHSRNKMAFHYAPLRPTTPHDAMVRNDNTVTLCLGGRFTLGPSCLPSTAWSPNCWPPAPAESCSTRRPYRQRRLGELVLLHTAASQYHCRLCLVRPTPRISRMLENHQTDRHSSPLRRPPRRPLLDRQSD